MEGNQMKMREALVEALNKVNDAYDILSKPCVTLEEVRQACREVRGIIIPALSAPPRQCDVGTAEEQAERFRNLCNKYYDDEHPCNQECPLVSIDIIHGFPRCQAYWAQTPYAAQEGATDGE